MISACHLQLEGKILHALKKPLGFFTIKGFFNVIKISSFDYMRLSKFACGNFEEVFFLALDCIQYPIKIHAKIIRLLMILDLIEV